MNVDLLIYNFFSSAKFSFLKLFQSSFVLDLIHIFKDIGLTQASQDKVNWHIINLSSMLVSIDLYTLDPN